MSNGVSVLNIGDIVATIIMLGFFAIPIILGIFFYKAYTKNRKRAEEQLNVEKHQTIILQKQVEALNERVMNIEHLLNEKEN